MSLLLVEALDHVEVWTLNRPEALNAFNKGLLMALNRELDRLEALDAACEDGPRAVVLTGAGDRSFSAGADLRERRSMPPEDVPAFVDLIGGTFDRIARAAIPFVAAINGFAFGGGLEIALACDVRVAATNATLGLTEARLAIIPGAGGTQRLPRLVGVGRAKEMILTGRRLGAEEAFRVGLVEHLSEEGEVRAEAVVVAQHMASCGPVAVRAAKAAIDGGLGMALAEGLRFERSCYDRTLDTEDRLEALAAFAEKRPPDFRGR